MLQEVQITSPVLLGLAFAVAVLSLFSAASVGAAVAFAQSWLRASTAFTELRSWYKGHAEQKTVEALMRAQVEREMARRQPQPALPAGPRLRVAAANSLPPEPEHVRDNAQPISSLPAPPSSKPAPLDQTWPSGAGPLPQPHSGTQLNEEQRKAFLASVAPLSASPPELPALLSETSWDDIAVQTMELSEADLLPDSGAAKAGDALSTKTVEVSEAMLLLADAKAVAANDDEPMPLVRLLDGKATVVWVHRKAPKVDAQ